MRKPELDENGLPLKGSRNPSGMLSVKLSDDDWDKVSDLMTHWGKETRIRISIGDTIRACIIQAHKRMTKGLQQEEIPDVPDLNGVHLMGEPAKRKKRSRRPTPGGT